VAQPEWNCMFIYSFCIYLSWTQYRLHKGKLVQVSLQYLTDSVDHARRAVAYILCDYVGHMIFSTRDRGSRTPEGMKTNKVIPPKRLHKGRLCGVSLEWRVATEGGWGHSATSAATSTIGSLWQCLGGYQALQNVISNKKLQGRERTAYTFLHPLWTN
jgi:hypothetical protein